MPNLKLRPEIKAAWLEALRSGDYQQTKSILRGHDNTFCCLGVLCDLAAKDGMGEWDASIDPEAVVFIESENHFENASFPAYTTLRWALGVSPSVVLTNTINSYNGLAKLNDTGSTFNEIADRIEREF